MFKYRLFDFIIWKIAPSFTCLPVCSDTPTYTYIYVHWSEMCDWTRQFTLFCALHILASEKERKKTSRCTRFCTLAKRTEHTHKKCKIQRRKMPLPCHTQSRARVPEPNVIRNICISSAAHADDGNTTQRQRVRLEQHCVWHRTPKYANCIHVAHTPPRKRRMASASA